VLLANYTLTSGEIPAFETSTMQPCPARVSVDAPPEARDALAVDLFDGQWNTALF